jgi:nitrate reductase gamma subunit
MEHWLELARGPIFFACLAFMILGLIRHLALTVWEVARAVYRAGDRNIPYRQVTKTTVKWLFPLDKLRDRAAYSVTTFSFHFSLIIAPLMLKGHIVLIERGTGLSWWGIPNGLATLLTAVAIVTAFALVVQRVSARDSRHLSRFQDYALPLVIAVPFLSGFLIMHPGVNPFPHQFTFLVHVMSANLIFILIPITKLNHIALLPLAQLVGETAWHFTPDAGSRLAVALGKENESL